METLSFSEGLLRIRSQLLVAVYRILRRLPIIGDLFGSTVNNDARTELIVLLTPHVVRSSRQVDTVMKDLQQQFGDFRSLTPP